MERKEAVLAGIGHLAVGMSMYVLYKDAVNEDLSVKSSITASILSVLPDFDLFVGIFLNGDSSTFHRMISHNPLLVLMALLLIRLIWHDSQIIRRTKVAGAIIISHYFLDNCIFDIFYYQLNTAPRKAVYNVLDSVGNFLTVTLNSANKDIYYTILFIVLAIFLYLKNRLFQKRKTVLFYKKAPRRGVIFYFFEKVLKNYWTIAASMIIIKPPRLIAINSAQKMMS